MSSISLDAKWEWVRDKYSIMVTNNTGKYLLTHGTFFTIAGDKHVRLERFHGSSVTGICIMECRSYRRENDTLHALPNVFKNIGPAIVGCATPVFDWNNVKFHFEEVKWMPNFYNIHKAKCACTVEARIPACQVWFMSMLEFHQQVGRRHVEFWEKRQRFDRAKRIRSESAAESPKRVRIDLVETSKAK